MKLTTAQIYSPRAKSLKGEGYIIWDITVKSGDKNFAPSWDIVMGYKDGTVSEKAYTARYRNLMRESIKKNMKAWRGILAAEKVCLVCYCPIDKARGLTFCHRILLREYLIKVAERWGINVDTVPESGV